MIAKSLDKYAGALSLLWIVGGYAIWRFGMATHHSFLASIQSVETIVSIVWFGISILLVTAGLRRGNTVGRICALCAIGFLFLSTEHLHRLGNLFRKDEYADIYIGAPECRVKAMIRTGQEETAFLKSITQFAKLHQIRECRQKLYGAYSGPSRPTYKGEHVAIWSGVGWPANASEKTGTVRLAPFDEAYPVEDFKRLADSLASTMRSALQGHVEVIYKEPEKP